MQKINFLKVTTLGSLIFGAIFFLTLFTSSPDDGAIVKITFYISIFLFSWFFVSLVSFILKRKLTNNEIVYSAMIGSFRQGLMFAFFLLGVLLLAAIDLLTWWDMILLALSFLLLELYFKSNKVAE